MTLLELKINQIVENVNNIKEKLVELEEEKQDLYIQLIVQYNTLKEVEEELTKSSQIPS